MSLVDQFGAPYRYTHKFAHAADRSMSRGPHFQDVLADLAVLVPQNDRQTLQSLSRRLYTNHPVLKAATDQKAHWSVGNAFKPLWLKPDEAALEARQWVVDMFLPIPTVRGSVFTWNECLQLISQGLDRDGEHFVLLTESKTGEPRIQLIPSHRIGQRDVNEKEVKGGPYRGASIVDGVIQNEFGRAIAYRVLGEKGDGSQDRDISARELLHVFDPDFAEQVRGLPAATSALTDLLTTIQANDFERIAGALAASIGLIEYNEAGGPDMDDPYTALKAGSTALNGITTQTVAPHIHHIASNSGGKLEVLKNDRPGSDWESYQNRLLKGALLSMGWSYSLWQSGSQGTAVRDEVGKLRRTISQRQVTLETAAQRIIAWAVGKKIDDNTLRPFKRFWDIAFTHPPRLTVDDGREAVATLKLLEGEQLTTTQVQGWAGRTADQHYSELWMDEAIKARTKAEVEAATGLTLAEPEEAVEEGGEQMSAAAEIKEEMDAYGVGVRAGTITPQTEDEAHFRSKAGLPAPSTNVNKLWKTQEGTRQPITLVQEGTEAAPTKQAIPRKDEDETIPD